MRMTAPSERSGRAGGDAIALLSGRLYRAQQIQVGWRVPGIVPVVMISTTPASCVPMFGLVQPHVYRWNAFPSRARSDGRVRPLRCEAGHQGTNISSAVPIDSAEVQIRARATSPEECGFQTDVAAARSSRSGGANHPATRRSLDEGDGPVHRYLQTAQLASPL